MLYTSGTDKDCSRTPRLGSAELANRYINPTKQYFFSRGHLTANADGIWAHEKKATFYFVNVIPQWQNINAGNWERLESSIRNLAQRNRSFIKVYTGASGVSTLKDINNNDKPIYLGKDSAGRLKNVLPVPKFMYKVIINEAARTGVAVVTINNPYSENHKAADVLCQSVCNQITWITFDTSDFAKGYTYCCDVQTFYNALQVIPNPGNLPLMK
ncbi:unnamed protein product [Allacma fusca]|uniref:DNA/RNA non-specific endonuclease n=1 Tax=Allacma fusca TaxID=39272 RepID=A0A8J2LIX3_9HEXA|nr:unnamed protein product [Allacma fusca]